MKVGEKTGYDALARSSERFVWLKEGSKDKYLSQIALTFPYGAPRAVPGVFICILFMNGS